MAAAAELGSGAAVASISDALACDIVVTVTPGREPVLGAGLLRAGQHVSLMGADGPGKAEAEIEELLRCRIVCDEWEQASHNGEIAHAVAAGRLAREDVAELGLRPSRRAARTPIGRRDHGVRLDRARRSGPRRSAAAILERYRAEPAADAFAGVNRVELASGIA